MAREEVHGIFECRLPRKIANDRELLKGHLYWENLFTMVLKWSLGGENWFGFGLLILLAYMHIGILHNFDLIIAIWKLGLHRHLPSGFYKYRRIRKSSLGCRLWE